MTNISPLECFQMYLAMKMHFDSKSTYNYVKYEGKTSATFASYEKRKDKYFFGRAARAWQTKEKAVDMFVAAFTSYEKPWIGQLMDSEADDYRIDMIKRRESLTKIVMDELDQFLERNLKAFIFDDDNYPEVFNAHIRGEVSIETLLVLNHVFKIFELWRSKKPDDKFLNEVIHRAEAYSAFWSPTSEQLSKLKGKIKEKLNGCY